MISSALLKPGDVPVVVRCLIPPYWLTDLATTMHILADLFYLASKQKGKPERVSLFV
jgi:hypothetical protein